MHFDVEKQKKVSKVLVNKARIFEKFIHQRMIFDRQRLEKSFEQETVVLVQFKELEHIDQLMLK